MLTSLIWINPAANLTYPNQPDLNRPPPLIDPVGGPLSSHHPNPT
jgi:hypothetical protein